MFPVKPPFYDQLSRYDAHLFILYVDHNRKQTSNVADVPAKKSKISANLRRGDGVGVVTCPLLTTNGLLRRPTCPTWQSSA